MSIYGQLLSGVEASIATLNTPVSLRDDIFLLEREVPPITIVAPGPEHEEIRFQTFNKNIAYDYVVLVALIYPGNRIVGANLQAYLDLRQSIRNQLYQIEVPGLTITWDTKIKFGPVSKFPALVSSNYKVTGWEMKYSVAEVRQGATG